MSEEEKEAIDIVLNLIKKQENKIANQEKEIKELKKKSYKCEYLEEGAEEIIKNSISKDKIKEKIEFIKSLKEKFYYEENVISILEELLEE